MNHIILTKIDPDSSMLDLIEETREELMKINMVPKMNSEPNVKTGICYWYDHVHLVARA